ncbi:MAG: nitrate/nitrite transporter NrtS [Gemmatimonadota bacterium]
MDAKPGVGLRSVWRSAARTSLVVGTVLTLINQWPRLRQGGIDLELMVRIMMNFLVPFSVASYSRLAVLRERDRFGTAR